MMITGHSITNNFVPLPSSHPFHLVSFLLVVTLKPFPLLCLRFKLGSCVLQTDESSVCSLNLVTCDWLLGCFQVTLNPALPRPPLSPTPAPVCPLQPIKPIVILKTTNQKTKAFLFNFNFLFAASSFDWKCAESSLIDGSWQCCSSHPPPPLPRPPLLLMNSCWPIWRLLVNMSVLRFH